MVDPGPSTRGSLPQDLPHLCLPCFLLLPPVFAVGEQDTRGHTVGKLHPFQDENTCRRKERMESTEGQENGEEPEEIQKAVIRASVQRSNPSLSLASRHLSSCCCSGAELAPSPCSWPQTLPSQPAPTRAGAKNGSTIPASVQWDGEDARSPLSALSPSLPILPVLSSDETQPRFV